MTKETNHNVCNNTNPGNRPVCRDGFQEQIVLLNELSQKLDMYFARRIFEDDSGQRKF